MKRGNDAILLAVALIALLLVGVGLRCLSASGRAQAVAASWHSWAVTISDDDQGRFGLSGVRGRLRWMPGWLYSFDNATVTSSATLGCKVFVPLLGEPLEIVTWASVDEKSSEQSPAGDSLKAAPEE